MPWRTMDRICAWTRRVFSRRLRVEMSLSRAKAPTTAPFSSNSGAAVTVQASRPPSALATSRSSRTLRMARTSANMRSARSRNSGATNSPGWRPSMASGDQPTIRARAGLTSWMRPCPSTRRNPSEVVRRMPLVVASRRRRASRCRTRSSRVPQTSASSAMASRSSLSGARGSPWNAEKLPRTEPSGDRIGWAQQAGSSASTAVVP